MKKIALLLAIGFFFAGTSFGQTQKSAGWAEMKAFHNLMSVSFHGVEEGNYAPLKEKATEMYRASKVWFASEIPGDFKTAETKANLEKLMIQCHDLMFQVSIQAAEDKLKAMITSAHDTYHKIVGECKK